MSGKHAPNSERPIGGFKFRLSNFQEAEKDSAPEEVPVVEPDLAAALIRLLALLFGSWAMRRLFNSSSSVWSWPSLSGLSSRLFAGDPDSYLDSDSSSSLSLLAEIEVSNSLRFALS